MKTIREESLFALALAKPPAERATFLGQECGGDVALRQRVEALLAAHDATANPLATQLDPRPDELRAPDVDSARSSRARDEAIGEMLGRYKLLEKLGEGGFGAVWLAEQRESVRRKVALKIIKLGMDTKQVVARFEAERQALAMMDHPNIAKVLDAGTTDSGRPFFVMELVRGVKATEYCDQNQLPTQERLDLFIKVCQAIQHAHQKGIIHRDIKPSNILVTLHDGVPVPKVIDFGIAKATQGELTDKTIHTQFQQFIGTPAYMSPEQAEMSGLDIDTRSDIYSLGVLLYELLTGKTPFDAKELMSQGLDAMRRTIREMEPVRPSTKLATLEGEERTTTAKRHAVELPRLIHQLKGDLDWIVMKCLEKDRTRRYETANGLAADLRRHLTNEPVTARPPSAAYKLQKAFRRNKLVFGAGMAVLAALVFGLALTLWQYAGKSRAERLQAQLRAQAEEKAREAAAANVQASRQRDLAQARLYESLVREAGSLRKARQIGYRQQVFERLRQARALAPANRDPVDLRCEASACLGDWVGLAPIDLPPGEGISRVAALSSDGSLAAVRQESRKIVIYESRTGGPVASLETSQNVWQTAFDSRGTALFVITYGSEFIWGRRPENWSFERWLLRGDGSWRMDSRRPLSGIADLAVTNDGLVLLEMKAGDARIAFVDPESGQEQASLPNASRLPWWPILALSQDRRQLAFFSLEQTNQPDVRLELWELAPVRRVANLQPRLSSGWGLTFSQDGRSLVATYENTFVVHDTAQFGVTLNQGGSFESTGGVALGGVGGLLAIPSAQELAVRLVQVQSGSEIAYLKLPGSPAVCTFSRDGSVLMITHTRGTRLIRLRSDEEKLRLEGHQGGVPVAEFNPDGRQLVSAGKDRTLRLWDPVDGGAGRVLGQLPAPGQTLVFTPDGHRVVCGYYNSGELSVWSIDDGRQLATISRLAGLTNDPGTTWNLSLSRDSRYLAAVGRGIQVWDLAGLPPAGIPSGWSPTLLLVDPKASSGVCFAPDSSQIYYGDWNRTEQEQPRGTMTLFARELAAGAAPRALAVDAMDNVVQSMAVHPDTGDLIYVNKSREYVSLNPADGRKLHSIPTRQPGSTDDWFVGNFRLSPDARKLANLSLDGLGVEVRDSATGRLLFVLPEETGTIWWLAWSPDGHSLVVTRSNGAIDVWNLPKVEASLAGLGLWP